jgi:cytochrome b
MLPNALQLHFYAGYTCIALVVFRISWGVFGTYYAKFSQFVVSPFTGIKYLRNKQSFEEYIGHNPAGAYSVIVLLALVLTQAISGLFISDEIFSDGPYYGVLGDTGQSIANFLHHNVFYVLLGFICLHVFTIIYYKFACKENLTSAMITGNKDVKGPKHNPEKSEQPFPWIGFVVSVVISALVMYLILYVLPVPPSVDYFGY